MAAWRSLGAVCTLLLLCSIAGSTVDGKTPLLGAAADADPNDPLVQEIAKFAVSELNAKAKENDVTSNKDLVRVRDAKKQVVAGVNYILTIELSSESAAGELCQVVVWDQPWVPKRELLAERTYCVEKETDQIDSFSSGNPNNLETIDVKDKLVNELASDAVRELRHIDQTKIRDLAEILVARKKANGYTYLTLKLVSSNYIQSDTLAFEICEVELADGELKSHACFPLEKLSSGKGGSLEEINRVSMLAVHEINEASSSKYYQSLVNVKNAEYNVTPGSGGSLTMLVLEMSPTLCLKSETDAGSSQCSVNKSHNTYICSVALWKRPWANEESFVDGPKCRTSESHDILPRSVHDGSVTSDDLVVPETAFCTGCPVDIPTHEPKLLEITSFAIALLDESTPEDAKLRKVTNVHHANMQVVSGIKYTLEIELSHTTCGKENGDISRESCEADPNQAAVVCNIEVLIKPWLHEKSLLWSNCNEHDSAQEIEMQKTDSGRSLMGEEREASLDSATLRHYATSALQTLDEIDADDNARVLIEVLSVKQKIVSGLLYIMQLRVGNSTCPEKTTITKEQEMSCLDSVILPYQLCEIKFLWQPWQPRQEKLVESQCAPEETIPSEHPHASEENLNSERQKRSSPGSGAPVSVSSSEVTDAANFALSVIDGASNSLYKLGLVSIVSATRKTVSGHEYTITMQIRPTDCPRSSPRATCNLKAEEPSQTCTAVVWVRNWVTDSPKQVTNFTCQSDAGRSKRSIQEVRRDTLVGGVSLADVNSAGVQDAAAFVLSGINAASNSRQELGLVRVINATRQVVAGVQYTVTLEVGPTNCERDSTEQECKLTGEISQICVATVWVRAWLTENSKQITSMHCDEPVVENVKKRSLYLGTDDSYEMSKFFEFMRKHGKKYSTEQEFQTRFTIFKKNLGRIQKLVSTEQGTGVYGITKFADLTPEEFKNYHLGLRPDLMFKGGKYKLGERKKSVFIPRGSIPDSFDWREHKAVTPVKNQGNCGSCWAFSVTGNIEGQWAVRHQELLSLSEQELVDCDKLDQGCNGGLPINAYKTLEKLGGIETETEYPYKARDGVCHFNMSETAATVKDFIQLPPDEGDMARWLVKNGPISIGINANAMQFYFGGVSHPLKFLCDPADLDHGVLIVGYGVHTTRFLHRKQPYWIVKNSWGTGWGEKGYYRVYRGDGTCGVNQMATSAVVG